MSHFNLKYLFNWINHVFNLKQQSNYDIKGILKSVWYYIRIHYPLPLPYVGKPDPVHLQDMNRKLKEEIKNLKNQLTKETQSYQAEKKQKQ